MEVYFESVPDSKNKGNFGNYYRRLRDDKTKPLAKKVSDNIIGVGLSLNRPDYSSCSAEFRKGIYLPIMFDYHVPGNLFIDLANIVSKVIYEPKLITEETKKALRSKTT